MITIKTWKCMHILWDGNQIVGRCDKSGDWWGTHFGGCPDHGWISLDREDSYREDHSFRGHDELTEEERESMILFVEGFDLLSQSYLARKENQMSHAAEIKSAIETHNLTYGSHRWADTWQLGHSLLSDAEIAKLKTPTPTEKECHEAFGPRSMPRRCQNGSVQVMSDIWESCRGCASCWPLGSKMSYGEISGDGAHVAWALGAFIWRAARVDLAIAYRASCTAFGALARIGLAIEAALSLGASLGYMCANAIENWLTPAEGCCYRVTGGRGTAAKCKGFLGQCVKLYKNDYGTLRAKLVAADGSTNTVAATQMERVVAPTIAKSPLQIDKEKKAARDARPKYQGRVGRNGETGYVHSGPHAGSSGLVFWASPDGERLGIKTCRCGGRCGCPPLWVSARDVMSRAQINAQTEAMAA